MGTTIAINRPMERRGSGRATCRTPVRIYLNPHSLEESFELESTDVGPDGLFLHTDLLFPIGEWLDLELAVPGRPRPVRSRGRVVRVDAEDEGPGPGVGVHLRGLRHEDRTALGRLGSGAWRAAD